MEIYTGPEQRPTDIYMMPGTAPNTHLTYVPQFEEVDYTGSDMASEYIYDQGLYYPTANYYGYYSGFESPGEWDDHSSFFGADGQDPRYSSLQAESSSYVYYTPSYGYTQSPYNPYNPYIPGAAIGLDVPYFGTQQYVTNPSYQTPVSSAAYVPVIQPSTDVSNGTQSPSLVSTAAAMSGRHVNVSAKYTPPLASINVAAKTQRSASGNPTPETSQASQSRAKSSEGLLANVPSNKQSLLPLGSTTHAAQARNSSGSVQASNHLSHGRGSTIPNPLKNTAPSNDSFPQYGSNIRGWATADKFRPRLQFYGDLSNPSGGTDTTGEQNRGPRTNKSKWTPAVVDGVIVSKSGSSIAQQSIVISADQYNRDDFPVSYPDAKFFVIKSYSEDDVHKSIKYKVWSSTSNGNKRLDSAYQDAQRISVGQRRNCPIFLFFSVNASGQFCGVAEMIGPVEFDKDMDFWQQDKWTGSFPVKWHIIKDVPNTSFRHIILENNENKPVTNSRDTQEIPYLPGLNMLNIFKGTIVKTSILDDFVFYEDRESIMQEEKARLHGRSYDGSQFLRAVVPISQSGGAVSDPCQAEDTNGILNKSLTANEKLLTSASSQPAKADGMPLLLNGTVVHPSSTTRKPPNGAVNHQVAEADGRPPNIVIRSPLKAGGRGHGKTVNHAVDHPAKADGKSTNIAVDQSPSIPSSSSTTPVEPPIADKNSSKLKDPKNIADKPGTSDPMDAKNTGDRPSNPMDKDSSKLNNMKSISEEPAMSERKDKKNTSDQRPSKPKDSTGTKWIAYEPQKYVLKDTKKNSDHRPSKLKDSSSSTPKGPKAATRKESETSGEQPPNVHGNDPKGVGTQHSKADRITSKPKDQVIRKLDSIIPNNDKGDPKQKYALHAGGTSSHAVASKGESSSSGVTDTTSNPMNVVTIGSVPISVRGLVESSSGVITVGTIPIEPKSSKYRQGASSGSLPIQK